MRRSSRSIGSRLLFCLLTLSMSAALRAAPEHPGTANAEFQSFVVEGVLPNVERLELTVIDASGKPIDGALLYVEADRIEGTLNLPLDVPVTIEAKGYDSKGSLVSNGAQDVRFNGMRNGFAAIDFATPKRMAAGGITVSPLRVAVTGTRPYDDELMQFTLEAFDAKGERVAIDPETVQWDIPFPPAPGGYMPCKPSGDYFIPCIEMKVPLRANPTVIGCIRNVICRATLNNHGTLPSIGYRAISAGDAHTCALTLSGRIQCWGTNTKSQLGTSTPELCTFPSHNGPLSTPCSSVPLEIPCPTGSPCRYIALDAGLNHTCAIDVDGAAWCWGDNFSQQLGFRSCTPGSPTPCASVPMPTKVVLPTNPQDPDARLVQISAGAFHNCAITARNNLVCWGDNNFSQAGDVIEPDAHFIGTPAAYSRVSAGSDHSCAVTQAGGLECWGYNGRGQIVPTSLDTYFELPTDVLGGHPSLSGKVDWVAAGNKKTCAHAVAGNTYCWGVTLTGDIQVRAGVASDIELGFVASSPSFPQDEVCLLDSASVFCAPTHANSHWVFPTRDVIDVTVGGSHYCAVLTSGIAVCWGKGDKGQLGSGTKLEQELPTRVLGP